MIRLATFFAVLLSFVSARADSERAPDGGAFARGVQKYQQGAYAEAVIELTAAQKANPQPSTLYALAQAERLAGDCKAAMGHYLELLAMPLAENQAAETRVHLETCERVERQRQAAETPTATPVPIIAPLVPAPEIKRRWYRTPFGAALLAGGVIALGVGAGLYASAHPNATIAQVSYTDYLAQHDEQRRQIAGASLLGVGGGLIAAAIVTYAINFKLEDRRLHRVTKIARALTLSGEF